MPRGSSTPRTATSWRPTPRPRSCSNARTSRAWTPTTRSPTLEDLAYWDGVRCGVVSVLESDCRAAPARRAQRAPSRAASRRSGWPTARPLFLVQVRDRSREHRIEVERETALAELRATLEATADAILVTDLHGRIRAFNRRFAAHVGAARRRAARRRRPRRARVGAHERDGRRRLRPPAGGGLRAHAGRGARPDRAGQRRASSSATRSRSGATAGRSAACSRSARRNPHRTGAPREPGNDGIDQLTHLPNRTGFLLTLEDALRSGRAERRLRRAVHRVQPRRAVRRGRRQRRRRAPALRACRRRRCPGRSSGGRRGPARLPRRNAS